MAAAAAEEEMVVVMVEEGVGRKIMSLLSLQNYNRLTLHFKQLL